MSKSLAGKIALVTGASRGIGRAIAESLAQDGALDAFAVAADLSKKGAAQALFASLDQELSERTGDTKFDILINNAGIAPFVSFADTTEAVLDEIFTVNVKSLFLITQEAESA
jgi:3-oxoacyl-[acyl-carrier protein] reductase